MTVQFSITVRDARLNAIEATIGPSPTLEIRTGAQPANCAAPSTGTLLVSLTLPADWENPASGGSATLNGTWSGTAVAGSPSGPWHWRMFAGATCHMQGDIGTDLILDATTITIGQTVTITTWTPTSGNP